MSTLQPDTIIYLQSLPISELKLVLSKMPREKQVQALAALMPQIRNAQSEEREKDVQRKRSIRSESARVIIPECADPVRREKCVQDPERFLRTYFPHQYRRAFCADHKRMITAMEEIAARGGRQAIAAPRKRGKSEITKGMVCKLILSEKIRFPLAVAATTDHAHKLYMDLRTKLATNDLLLADFPEVCYPIRALEGAPQRAGKQHVDGFLTRIVWTATDYISLPYVPNSPFGGVKYTYFGLDSAIRGINIEGDRPDFITVDDPETEESARNIEQIQKRDLLLDRGVAGLGGDDRELAILILTTIQNRYCYSFRVTDRKIKPAWNGLRFGMIIKWPDRIDLWEEYVAIRHQAQTEGDQHGLKAVEFYLQNREAMDAGCEMLTDEFIPITLDNGMECVYSSLQQCWNFIANTSMAAFLTEYQNDPEPEEAIETSGLTAAKVQSRIGRTVQGQVPKDALCTVMGIDIGKRVCHWTDIACEEGAIGTIHDYGVIETYGTQLDSTDHAVERSLLASLETFAEQLKNDDRLPLLCLIDSGRYSPVIYEFCRRFGPPFFPSKGWQASRFRMPQKTDTKVPFEECWAHWLADENSWLYNVNTEYWKDWLHKRFIVVPYDDHENRTEGSLVLFDPVTDKKRHLSFSHHIVAEELRLVPVAGKELKREWFVKSRTNHWLDSTALACAAMSCVGIRLITNSQQQQPQTTSSIRAGMTGLHGQSFVATRST
jgi:hypothetical protein